MTKVREAVEIEAPAARVWAVVQEDAENAPKWSSNLAKVEQLDAGPPGKGTRYRYHLNLPAGYKAELEVEQTSYVKPKHCNGKFVKGPLKGTWSYTYSEHKDGTTRLVYEMDYQLGGLLRLAGGVLAHQYAEGIRHNMDALKKYVESGKGPKARR
ncbi:MAG TPA: SRPBCC family protein [Candidatus Dormibacteraeota bacterium]|nr:SRPBCC family protein [Candidatus Dormibacteraeota bacterium]